eukprot:COSAG02_NODE_2952_length_7672_cov_2.928562_3_plen_107_part_00
MFTGKQWGHRSSPAVNIGMGHLDASIDEADGFRIEDGFRNSDVDRYKQLAFAGEARDWTPKPATVDQTSFGGAQNEQDNTANQGEASTLQSVSSKEQGLMAMKSAQ